MDKLDLLLNINKLKEDYIRDIEDENEKVKAIQKPLKKSKAQNRAERKERRRLEKVEDRKIFLRDHMTRELELSKRSQKRFLDGWQDVCGQIKVKELRKELVAWGEQANRLMDKSNYKIELLLQNIDATQELLMRGQSKTEEIVGFIKSSYDILLKSAENLNDLHVHDMFKNFAEEMKRRTADVQFMQEATQTTTQSFNVTAIDTIKENYEIFLKNRESIINDDIEERYSLRDNVAAQMQEMHDHLIAFIAELRVPEWDDISATDMESINESQKEITQEIKTLDAKEMEYICIINKLEQEFLKDETNANAEINELNLELAYFKNVRQKFVDNLGIQTDLSTTMLKNLCVECYDIKQDFDKFVKTGELLLSLSTNCRKLQSKAELDFPCGESPPLNFTNDIDEKFKIESLDLREHLDMTEEDIMKQNQFLSNFFRRISMVESQNMMLLEEKRKLIEKRDKYINFIKSKLNTANTHDLGDLIQVTPIEQQNSHATYKNINLKSVKNNIDFLKF